MDLKKTTGCFEKFNNDIFYLEEGPKFKYITWSVFHFGKSKDSSKFSYSINIADKIKMEVPCQPCHLHDSKTKYISVSLPVDALSPYLTDLNKLKYTLQIKKKIYKRHSII